MKDKSVRVTTILASLNRLLKEQLHFVSEYYEFVIQGLNPPIASTSYLVRKGDVEENTFCFLLKIWIKCIWLLRSI
jgi:hypothetical protein